MSAAGARVIAVQDHTGTVYREAGLDIAALQQHVNRSGGVAGAPGTETLDGESFWQLSCEILIFAALEGQITGARA